MVEGGPGHQLRTALAGQCPAPDQACVQAGIVAVEVDHAAGLAFADGGIDGVDLGGHGNGLPLRHRALANVGGELALAQRAGVAEPVPPLQTALCLAGFLARVEERGLGRGLVGVGLELLARQAQRVLCRLVQCIEHHHYAVGGILVTQAHVAQRALCRAVRAKAVDLESGERGAQAEAVVEWRIDAQAQLGQAGAAGIHTQRDGALHGRRAEQRDDAARAVAVQRRERAAQHFHALRAGEVEVRDLALAVGTGGGNAVGVQAHAAHAEAGARAEAARADLQVLCIVVAQVHHQARHARHGFGQVDHRPGAAQLGPVHHAHGVRCVEETLLGAAADDDDGFLGVRGGLGLGRGRQRQGGQPPPTQYPEAVKPGIHLVPSLC